MSSVKMNPADRAYDGILQGAVRVVVVIVGVVEAVAP
jgi:hypothetical protein